MFGRPELDSNKSGYNDVVDFIKNNSLEKRVKILSYISDDERNALLYNADLFVTTSMQEGFGRTPVEAAMCEIPVISSTETSLHEATKGKVYYYENATDDEELANKILEVLNNRPSKDRLIDIAKELEEEYNQEKIAKMLMDLIEEICIKTN